MRRKITLVLVACSLFSPALVCARAPVMPKPDPLSFSLPKGKRYQLSNGLVFYLLENHSVPVVRAYAVVDAGRIYDSKDKIGLSALTAVSMRSAGTERFKADDVNNTLEYLGASVEGKAGTEYADFTLFALHKDFERVFDVFADMLVSPAFEPEKFQVEKEDALDSIKRRNDYPEQAARREAMRAFYGTDSPFGWREEAATVNAVAAEDLKSFHDKYYRPDAVILAVAGDFDPSAVINLVQQKFGKWAAQPRQEAPALAVQAPPKERKVYLINKAVANAPVYIISEGPKRHHPDAYNLAVANEILGGSGLSSRLFTNVRSRLGLAYSVHSWAEKNSAAGAMVAYCGTKNSTVTKAAREVIAQLEGMKTVVPQAELARAKDSMINSYIFEFKTPMEIMSERILREFLKYPPDYIDTYPQRIAEVGAAGVLESAKRWFRPDQSVMFVIGDSAKFDEPLSVFGPVTELKED